MENKTYKLLKDLPNLKAGAILTLQDNDCEQYCGDKDGTLCFYDKEFVENNPEWFCEVYVLRATPTKPLIYDNSEVVYKLTEKKFEWTDALIIEFAELCSNIDNYDSGNHRELLIEFKKRAGCDLSEEQKSARKYPLTPDDMQPKKDWEILSFSSSRFPNIPEWILKNGTYCNNLGSYWTLDEILSDSKGHTVKTGEIKIHSVKRLSDGSVFTIREKVSNPHETGHIEKFDLYENIMYVYFKVNTILCTQLKAIKKVIETPKYPEGILEFINFGNIVRPHLNQPYQSWCEENLKSNNRINKVKNNKGEIWTVRDETTYGKIEKIFLERNNYKLYAECHKENHDINILNKMVSKSFPIDDLQKPKQALFRTEDGFEIPYGIALFSVRKDNFTLFGHIDSCEQLKDDKTYLFFKHKENAEKYIKENKKQFSITDISEAIQECGRKIDDKRLSLFSYNLNNDKLNFEILLV